RAKDAESAFRYIIVANTLEQLERGSRQVKFGRKDFAPGFFEIYCEGAAMRTLGLDRGYEMVTVFFKHLGFSRRGSELLEIEKAVTTEVMARIQNKGDFVKGILLTPKDLYERFYFPKGNIDHVEIADG